MPFDSTKLAHVSNHDGNGDLHCLAHFIAAEIRDYEDEGDVKQLIDKLYTHYRLLKGSKALSRDQFVEKIETWGALDIEKEITPILEGVLSTMDGPSRLDKFVRLANYFQVKVVVHVQAPPSSMPIAQHAKRYAGLNPVKDVRHKRQAPVAEGAVNIIDQLVSHQQIEDVEEPSILHLFAVPSQSNSTCYDYYFESSQEAPELVAHNRCIQEHREKLRKKAVSDANPSFMSSLGAFVTMLGALAAKIIEVFSGIVQKFSAVSGGPSAPAAKAGSGSPFGGTGSSSDDLGMRFSTASQGLNPTFSSFSSGNSGGFFPSFPTRSSSSSYSSHLSSSSEPLDSSRTRRRSSR